MDVCEKFCIFRLGTTCFAVPAASVREVVNRPPVVSVPAAHPIVEGLCHLRAEFLPVLRLTAFMNQDESPAPSDQVIVMMGASGPWGISVDQVLSLEPLEVAINLDDDDRSSVVMGSANYRDQVICVLNHTSLLRKAQAVLKTYWQRQSQNQNQNQSQNQNQNQNRYQNQTEVLCG